MANTPEEQNERDLEIIQLAKDRLHVDGAIEVDSDAIVSEGDDNGAYVRVWAWVSFKDTHLDKQ